jgi:zinc D-Ala-D-Ala carboxypeptidase
MKNDGNYFIWQKGAPPAPLTKHFTTKEFDCSCSFPQCQEQRISIELIGFLELVRQEYGRPITVTSGYRCQWEQEDLRRRGYETASGKSQHELGNAADIKGGQMPPLVPILEKYFKSIGLARTWAHVDTRADKLRRWSYKG